MKITRYDLRNAAPENVARLARALRIELPPVPVKPRARDRWSAFAAATVADAIQHLSLLDACGVEQPLDMRDAMRTSCTHE